MTCMVVSRYLWFTVVLTSASADFLRTSTRASCWGRVELVRDLTGGLFVPNMVSTDAARSCAHTAPGPRRGADDDGAEDDADHASMAVASRAAKRQK